MVKGISTSIPALLVILVGFIVIVLIDIHLKLDLVKITLKNLASQKMMLLVNINKNTQKKDKMSMAGKILL